MKNLCLFFLFAFNLFVGCQNYELLETTNNNTSTSVPEGAITTKQQITRPNPPSGWTSVVCWLQAVTLKPDQYSDTAKVVLDYMKLLEYNVSSGITTTIETINYDTITQPRMLNSNEGGLYMRKPNWYCCNDSHTVMYNSLISNGNLTIDLSSYPNNIAHWWTNRHLLNSNCKYYLEINVKVIGKAAIQIGSDWWISLTSPWCTLNQCNTEAWVSDWFGDTKGEFKVYKVPINW